MDSPILGYGILVIIAVVGLFLLYKWIRRQTYKGQGGGGSGRQGEGRDIRVE